MADDTKKLEFQILTKYFGAGAAQAIVDQEKLAQGTKDLGGKTTEAAKATEEHVKHLEGSGKVFGALNKLVPELGHALHAAFMGPLGPIILVGLAISEVKSKLSEYNAELDKISDEQIAQHAEAIGKLKKAWDDAQTAMGNYKSAIETAGAGGDAIKQQLDGIKAVREAQLESSRQIVEALGKQEIAYLRANGASPQQIAAAEERQRRAVGAITAQKEFGAGVGGLQAEQTERAKNATALDEEAKAKRAEANKAKEENERAQDELQRLRGMNGIGPAGQTNSTAQIESKKLAELMGPTGEIERAVAVQGERDKGQRALDLINEQDQKTGKSLGEIGAAAGATSDQISTVVDKILTHQMTLQQAFAGYETRIKAMEQWRAQQKSNQNIID